MSRKRAIEAAVDYGLFSGLAAADQSSFPHEHLIAERAFDLGRIAGLREAARMLPSTKSPTFIGLYSKNIHEHANTLAKKARSRDK